jgi:hypothetical protein
MKVQVGEYHPDGTFQGETVEFDGREVDSWEGIADSIDPKDQFGMTLRLYESPDGYRVHEFMWSLSPGRNSYASLYPVVGYLGYGTYTEQEVREKWGRYFEWDVT